MVPLYTVNFLNIFHAVIIRNSIKKSTLDFPAKMSLPPEDLSDPALDQARLFVTHGAPEIDPEKAHTVAVILADVARQNLSRTDASAQLFGVIGSDEILNKFTGMTRSMISQRATPVVPGGGYRRQANRWTKEEDQRLLAAVQAHGADNWPLVAGCVGGGRTRSQCSQRWNRGLNPKIDKGNWSREEEQKLLDAVQTYGNKAWTRIASEMGNRSDVQCRFRYKFLQKKAEEANTEIVPISMPLEVTRRAMPETKDE